jgi:hypothetical protein
VLLFVFSHLLPVEINEGFHEPQGVDVAVMERSDKVGGGIGAAGFDRLASQQQNAKYYLARGLASEELLESGIQSEREK